MWAWKSKQLHIVLSGAGVYAMRVGGSTMRCPQDWAAKIHKAEQDAGAAGETPRPHHQQEATHDQLATTPTSPR